jgi:tetraacyldisaccharide 4'-kinase
VLPVTRLPVPVVVVGNVSVGGSGKTPLVRVLAAALRERGFRPGIVSRGYGARVRAPLEVEPGDEAARVGDEPLLLARDGMPVVVAPRRVAAGRALLARHPDVDVLLADDGLQHYALGRDVEIVVADATRGFGNGRLLPAGPLREAVSRIRRADALVWSRLDMPPTPGLADPGRVSRPASDAAAVARMATDAQAPAGVRAFTLTLTPGAWEPVGEGGVVPAFDGLPPGTVHAVAAIAHPQRFFDLLRARGIDAVSHAFADHHRFTPAELALPGASVILMTEKDAVKCRSFADARMFFLPLEGRVDPALVRLIEDRIHGRQAA